MVITITELANGRFMLHADFGDGKSVTVSKSTVGKALGAAEFWHGEWANGDL